MDDPSPARAQDTPSKIRQLLERLGIDPRDPWVWITTERPLSPDHTRARIDDGGAARWISLTEDGVKAWNGYSFNLIGIRWEATPEFLGLLQNWEDDLLLDVRYMRAQWQQSALYAEYVASEREGEDLRVGGFLLDYSSQEQDRALAGLKLLKDSPVSGRGKKLGDGQTWPGGLDEFLTDLWDTIDRYTEGTGRPWLKITGEVGGKFRTMMKGHPAERTLRDWLKAAGLRPQDVESGKVTRANYSQFVAEQGA
jgi:hypothetical protein